jgi:hypothetical protein
MEKQMSTRSQQELIGRWEAQKQVRSTYENALDEIVRLFMPFRDDITTVRAKGDKRIRGVFDTTGVMAADKFVNFLVGAIIPAQSDWLRLRIAGEFSDDLRVRRLLDKIVEKVMWRLSDSNFYTSAATFLRDFAILGSSVMTRVDSVAKNGKWKGFCFQAVPPGSVWWEMGSKEVPFIVFRKMEMPAIDAARHFKDNPGSHITLAAKRNPMAPVGILHVVYENEDGLPGGLQSEIDKPWISEWFSLGEQDSTEQVISLRTGGFDNNPFTIARWDTVDGEAYGRGRGHLARPDARGINELKRQVLIAAGRDLNPPLMIESKGMVKMDVLPDSVMVVKPPSKMAPNFLRSGTDYQAANMIGVEDRAQIEKAFLVDMLGEPDTQPRSAAETRARIARALQTMGTVAQRVDKEFLRPEVSSVIEKMESKRLLPEMQEIRELTGEDPSIVFQSPFFTAQKSAGMARVDGYIARRLQLFATTQDPIWLDDMDPDSITEYERRVSDLPAEIFADEEVVKAKREKRAEEEKLQRELMVQQAQQGGQVDGQQERRAGSPPQRTPEEAEVF